MLRHERRLIRLFLPIALVGFFAFATAASAQKVRVEAREFSAAKLELTGRTQCNHGMRRLRPGNCSTERARYFQLSD